MALKVYREYRGTFELVGEFERADPVNETFAYDEGYLERDDAAALSASLPLRHEPYASNEFSAFFSGMLPEGPVRHELSMRFQIPQSDYLSMLERLGDECVGALRFLGDEKSSYDPGYRPLQDEDFEALSKAEVFEIANDMQDSRLSLAGAQSKTGWFLPRGKDAKKAGSGDWMLPLGSAPSTHIVKIASTKHPDLPFNELICMTAASAAGLEIARSEASDTILGAFFSERYDRIWSNEPPSMSGFDVPLRLHQEDFCQAVGWPSYMKYETRPDSCYMALCGRLIREQSSNVIADTQMFARQVMVDYALGNCDSHLKNHSFLYSPSWREKRLAPAYDIVCTTIMGYDHNLGIDIGDHRVIDGVTPEDFEFMSQDLHLPLKMIKNIAAEVAEEVSAQLAELASATGDLGRVALKIQTDSVERMRVLEQFSA